MACFVASEFTVSAVDVDWLRDFRMFSVMHALVLIALMIITPIVLRIGLRRRDTPAQRTIERRLGIAGVIIWIIANGYGFLPWVFDWNGTLPLHVCDFCALVGPIVMLRERPAPWMRSVLYFWGLGLCTHAFITPTLQEGPADPMFWAFWGGHFVILIFALYDVIVRRWRPTWRDWRIAVALSVAYLAIVLPLDIAFEWNYGFVGREMRAGTLLEVLGPWPMRVAIIFGLAVGVYTCLMLPWVAARRLRS